MTISLTFKLKDHSWTHGDLVADFKPKDCIQWLVDNYDPKYFEKIDIFEMP